jgi:hypothetical protein
MPSPSKDNALHAVWGSSPTNVFAVGSGATILHYDGTKWALQNPGVAVLGDQDSTHLATFTGIWGTPDGSKVFVVGPDVPSPGMLQYPPWPKTLLDTALADACKLAREQSAKSPEARELAAACESAQVGIAAPPGASKPFPWHPPSPVAPAPKAVVYVNATNLRLRARANASADVQAEVPLNTRAEVRSVSGEWAEVEASVPAARMLGFGPDFKSSGEARRATGWAPWKFLAPSPCTKQDLLRDAALHEKQEDLPEAIRLLDRARALDSDDRAIDAELTRLTGTVRDDISGVAFLGCRGLRELAAVVDGSTGPKKLAATTTNACVIVSDPLGPCSPPDPYAAAPFSAEEACSPEYRGTTSLAACKKELAAQQHANDAATEKWQGEAQVFATKVHALQAIFPSSSTVRFVLGANRHGRIYAYRLPYTLYECQDSGATFDWQHLAMSSDALELSPASSPITVWVEMKKPVSAIVGLVEAPDSEQARAKVLAYKEKPQNNSDVAAMLRSIGPRPHVALPAPRCHCEGSPAVEW